MLELFAAADVSAPIFQYLINGLVFGALIALIALGYTMVYGIIELINFAHGDLFMLGCFFALQLAIFCGVANPKGEAVPGTSTLSVALVLALMLIGSVVFCSLLNVAVDRVIYKPLRNAPKLAPLVSAIGVSFVFMNVGLFWGGATDVNFPKLISEENLFPGSGISFRAKDAMVLAITIPTMIALTVFVRYTSLGKAMRATAQNPVAAQLMGINVDRVIAATFAIGGALAGIGSVTYSLQINTIGYQMGFQNGLYAFTAAVLGGIGNIPGAVLGGLLLGVVRSLASAYIGESWSDAIVFSILIVILIFRPNGLLGARVREKV
jgi:branched-chain amino acid transport system permease protein